MSEGGLMIAGGLTVFILLVVAALAYLDKFEEWD